MSYSSDIDLSSLHKANNVDNEVPYELSWHFNNKMHLHSHKHKKSEQTSSNSSRKNVNDHTENQIKHDVNNNFHAKAFKIKDDNFYSMHRGKSGTWP